MCAFIDDVLVLATIGGKIVDAPPATEWVGTNSMSDTPPPVVEEEKIATPKKKIKSINPVKPSSFVIPLRDARALAQRVKGTSEGSVYHVVAIGPVNVAIKEGLTSMSVRAEFQDYVDPKITTTLDGLAFMCHGAYWSLHLSTLGVPSLRVIGSLLLGMGVPFTSVATTKDMIYG